MVVTKKFIKLRNVSYIGLITKTSEDYVYESKNLTQEQSENIMFPEVLSTLQVIHKLESDWCLMNIHVTANVRQ